MNSTPTVMAPGTPAVPVQDSIMQMFNVGMVFQGKPGNLSVEGWAEPGPATPPVNPEYQLPRALGGDVITWFATMKDPLYVAGPTGCGKTSCIKQVVARFNWPVYEVTGHARLEMSDLIGHLTMRQGTMAYEYGPLAQAMRSGGLLLFNEIDLCDPSLLASLNTVLDGSPLCIAENGGEIIKPHRLFRFAATANTAGAGDDTGMYQGTLRQNLALMDRFMVLRAGYLTPDVEEKLILKAVPDLGEAAAQAYVAYANAVRNAFLGDGGEAPAINITLSTRTIIRWARLSVVCKGLRNTNVAYYALERALLFRADESTLDILRDIYQRIFGNVPAKK